MYTFTVARALKLEREKGINILNGSKKANELQDELQDFLPKIVELETSLTALNEKETLNKNEEIRKKEVESELLKYSTKIDRLKNTAKVEKFKYYTQIIPYFVVGEINIEEFEASNFEHFEEELTANIRSIFTSPKSDTGK